MLVASSAHPEQQIRNANVNMKLTLPTILIKFGGTASIYGIY
jgi:hypothetical protein